MKKMLKVLLVLMTVVSIAGCSSKTTTEKATKKTKTLSGNYQVEIKVKDYGTIYAEIDADTAPITVTNFVKLSKEKFYDDHRAELTLYESALRILKEKSQGNKLPTLKMLREEKNRLTELQTMQREDFNARREHERELRTVCSNVDIILGTSQVQNRQREHTQEKS